MIAFNVTIISPANVSEEKFNFGPINNMPAPKTPSINPDTFNIVAFSFKIML